MAFAHPKLLFSCQEDKEFLFRHFYQLLQINFFNTADQTIENSIFNHLECCNALPLSILPFPISL